MTDDHFSWPSTPLGQPKPLGSYEIEGVSERAEYAVSHDIPSDWICDRGARSIEGVTDGHFGLPSTPFGQPKPLDSYEIEGVSHRAEYVLSHDIPTNVL